MIPESIQVGPYPYTVKIVERLRSDSGEKLAGHARHGQGIIEIDSEQSAICMRETLLHEVLHGVCSTVGLWDEKQTYTEESFIRCVTAMLLDTLRRNPALVEYLTETPTND